ncbi:enoyl-CoA hydratase/isomerase family protein [Halorarius halobius]|uniref:enoyl-CoA hydratase/isomerase family protein n=1 Tax=Halorarius halobius TaxID=2962671 RepID=UPI0020CBD068|nr:enoyl-CoA hydratase/isomerase family protein [Halorarius halobius]
MSAPFAYAESDGVGTITMQKPPANGLSLDSMRVLSDALDTVRDEAVPVVVVESDLDGMFSAGGDLSWYEEATPGELDAFAELLHENLRRMETMGTLFLAAIDGHALAGGFELALGCDFRFVSRGDWRIGLTETDIGAIPGGGGTQRLPREVGRSRALKMIVDAEQLSPEEALEAGLVQELYDPDELEAAVHEYARELADGPTLAYAAAKEAVTRGAEMHIDDGLAFERARESELGESDDFEEGVTAFAEGREPEFEGR